MHSIHPISSKDNPRYKQLKKWTQDAGQCRRDGVALVEGIHLLEVYLNAIYHEDLSDSIDGLYLDHNKLAEFAHLINTAELAQVAIYSLDKLLLRGLSSVVEHQGCLLVIKRPQKELISEEGASWVYLENVQDPGNVGTIIRTASAAGIQTVLLSPLCADVWSPKVLRASQGAHFMMLIKEQVSLADLMSLKKNKKLYTTALKNAKSLYEIPLNEPCVWVFANEGSGASEEALNVADELIKIPHGEQVESLNVAVAAAICLFEQRRQQLL